VGLLDVKDEVEDQQGDDESTVSSQTKVDTVVMIRLRPQWWTPG
jgi:hypothetical protein